MRRTALTLTVALAAAGCAATPPMARLDAVPYQAKVQQVQAMTRTFSLAANQPLDIDIFTPTHPQQSEAGSRMTSH